jgi:hypothetical protein
MPCKSCEERRQIAAAAYKAGGVKAVVKSAPAIAKHMLRNRPTIIRKDKRNG